MSARHHGQHNWSPPLALPQTYLFAHFAQGGTEANIDLERFGEDVIPGAGALLARAWQASYSGADPAELRKGAEAIRREADKPQRTGKSSSLMLGDAKRFLADLPANLEIYAALTDLAAANSADRDLKLALRVFLKHMRPFQDRLGHVGFCGWLSFEALEAVV